MLTLQQIFSDAIIPADETFTELDGAVVVGINAVFGTEDVLTPRGYALVNQMHDVELLHLGNCAVADDKRQTLYTVTVRDLPDGCFNATEAEAIKTTDCERAVVYVFDDCEKAKAGFAKMVADLTCLVPAGG